MKVGDILKLKTKTITITEKLTDYLYRFIDNNGKTGFYKIPKQV